MHTHDPTLIRGAGSPPAARAADRQQRRPPQTAAGSLRGYRRSAAAGSQLVPLSRGGSDLTRHTEQSTEQWAPSQPQSRREDGRTDRQSSTRLEIAQTLPHREQKSERIPERLTLARMYRRRRAGRPSWACGGGGGGPARSEPLGLSGLAAGHLAGRWTAPVATRRIAASRADLHRQLARPRRRRGGTAARAAPSDTCFPPAASQTHSPGAGVLWFVSSIQHNTPVTSAVRLCTQFRTAARE